MPSKRENNMRNTATSADDLAHTLAAKLSISQPAHESKAAASMRAVNAASKSLSALIESTNPKSVPSSAATKAATAARNHLATLRKLTPGQVDIERAASSVVAKLITLQLYRSALGLLQDMRQPLIALYHPAAPLSAPLDLFALPPVDPPIPIPELHINLISSYLIQSLHVHLHNTADIQALAADIHDPSKPSLLAWIPALSTLPEKQYDNLLARAYTLTSRFASTAQPPSAAYAFRIYSLLCLAHTRPSVISPATFWEQAAKFSAMFAATDAVSPTASAKTVSDTCARLVAAVEHRKDSAEFMSGVAYVRFCEYWSRFAKQAGDLCALEQVGRLAWNGNYESYAEEDCMVMQSSALATSLARALAVFEQSTEVLTTGTHEFAADIARCGLALAQSGSDHDRVKRGLERLRRAAVKVVETPPDVRSTSSIDLRRCARAILEQIVDVHCEAITQRNAFAASVLTPALETLLTLARATFSVNSPETYLIAHRHLVRAAALLSEPPRHGVPRATLANYLRCVAGVHHYLAGQLHQSGRYDHTVRFAEEGCRLGQRALQMKLSANADEADGDESTGKAWALLEDQLYRRWELLAVCHVKTGDRKAAYEAFLKSVNAFPFVQHKFVELARTTPPTALYEASPALKQFGILLDRVTYIAACELFQAPAAVSATSWFAPLFDTADDGKCIRGALLERQIRSLEESRCKEGVQEVLCRLVDDALEVYSTEERPVRRARVMLKRFELSRLGEIDDGQEILNLLDRQDFALDSVLAPYAPEFTASLYLWLAVHAHRGRTPACSAIVIAHTEDACKVLRAMLPAPPLRPSGAKPARISAAELPKSQLPQRTTRGRAAAASAAIAVRTKAAASRAAVPTTTTKTKTPRAKTKALPPPPVTPKRRRAMDPVSLDVATTTPPKGTGLASQGNLVFDDFAKLVGLVRMVSHLIGLVGHILVKVQLLNAVRKLSERHVGVASEVYVSLTIDTAYEYVKLGRAEKAASILAHVLPAMRGGALSADVTILLLLRYSEALAASGEVLKASAAYCEAVAGAAECATEEKGMTTAQRVRLRAACLERAAHAALTYAALQDARDDPTSSIAGLMQALRLWNRAVDTLSRLQPPTKATKPPVEDNPFEVPSEPPSNPGQSPQEPPQILSPRASNVDIFADTSGWRLASGLLSTLLSLAHAYAARGSAREAEFFIQQTHQLAEALHSPVMASRALAAHGELQIQLGFLQTGHESLVRAAALLGPFGGADAAEIRRLQGRYNLLNADAKGARALFEEATMLLDELGRMFSALDGAGGVRMSLITSPRSMNAQLSDSVLAPTLLARVLRHQISLLHESGEEYTQLLDKFAKLSHSPEAKAEEIALRAKLTLDDVYSRFRADMFFSSLAESAMTIPMGMSGHIPPSSASQDMLETLSTAEKLFWDHLTYVARRGHVSSVREAAVCLALIRAFRTSLGRGDKHTPIVAAQLLDASTVTTLRREMVDVIRHKYLETHATDDLHWPLITPNGSPLPQSAKPWRRVLQQGHPKFPEENDDDGEPSSLVDIDLKSYWDSIVRRYEEQCFDANRLSASHVDTLPVGWTVVNVSVTDDRHTMFVTRQRAHQQPLIFCLPLKGRREGQEDEHLTFDDAIGELQEIIRLSDEGARQAGDVKKDDRAARVGWWKSRTALDKRLKELLADIEFCWLGAFKTIFSASRVALDDLAALRARLDNIFMGRLVFQDKKPKSRIGLDDGLLECFSGLPPTCRDEELEDLVYFILDLYQYHGVPVAISEVDMDQMVIELRNALEEHASRLKPCSIDVDANNHDDGHIFLVLDKNVQGIPWESLPVLRGKNASRIPSIDFLLDRLELAGLQKQKQKHNAQDISELDRATIDPRKTYFVLNPSGDLKGTEGRFSPWLQEMRSAGWDGIVGRPPSEQQLLDALATRDLVIYFGHGGAEQFVRSHKVRHLQRCAATMLWGCSSGTLKYMGDFDRTGTPYHYMLAGCPTLVANLWDVTDRDIDKFSQAVFDDLHLSPNAVKTWCSSRENDHRPTSVVAAVSHARDSCKLQYLTGAAPIVYGIPFYM